MTRRAHARSRRAPSLVLVPSVQPGPAPNLVFDARTATGSAGQLSTLGTATKALGSGSPLLEACSVTGNVLARFGATDAVATASSGAPFLGTGASTIVMVFRARKDNFGGDYPPFDSTENGTKAGLQLRYHDKDSDVFQRRILTVRIFDGSTWVLDEPGSEQWGHVIDLKWHVVTIRVSTTKWEIRIDGEPTLYPASTVSFAYAATATGKVVIGSGPFDIQTIQGWNSYLSDANIDAIEAYVAGQRGVDMVIPVIGKIDPASPTTPQYFAFPWLEKLPGGDYYATAFGGQTEAPADANIVVAARSSSQGASWAASTTILSSNSTTRYADTHVTTLSNGDVIRSGYKYDGAGVARTLFYQRSTDGGTTFGSITNVVVGSDTVNQTGGGVQEDPYNPGHLHWPTYNQVNDVDAFISAWDYQSSDYGATWARVKIADGPANSRQYSEGAFIFESTYIYFFVRDATSGGVNGMLHGRSMDRGTTWTSLTSAGLAAFSAAAGARKLASGKYVWLGRPSVTPSCAMFWRAASAAWNDAWQDLAGAFFVDCRSTSEQVYAAMLERSPGVIDFLWATFIGNSPNTYGDVRMRRNFYEWYIDRAMPLVASLTGGTVGAGSTQTITVRGAGDYVVAFTRNDSGGDVSISGSVLSYVVGPVNGTDTFTITDGNGYGGATCSFTVTGGVATWTPGLLAQTKAWFRPSAAGGITLDGGGNVATLPDLSGNTRTLSAANTSNAPAVTTYSGKTVVDFGNGPGARELLYPGHTLDAFSNIEVYFVGKFASAVPGVSGFWSMGTDGSGDFHPFAANAFYDCFGSNARYGPIAGPADLSTPFVYNPIASTSNWQAYINRTLQHSAGSNTVAWAAAPKIGRNVNGTATAMLLFEKVICSPPLTANLKTKLLDYFTATWGTP